MSKVLSAEANFNVGLVVREQIILAKFWRQTEEKKSEMLQTLLTTFNSIFETQSTLINVNNPEHYNATGGGNLTDANSIVMSKNSLMTFLHMYAATLRMNGFTFSEDMETNNSANWSHTIFCLASRSEYFSSKARGLFFVDAKFVGPLEGCTTREEVDAIYSSYILGLQAAGNTALVELSVETEIG